MILVTARPQLAFSPNVYSEPIMNSSCQSAATKNLIKSGAHMLPLAELAIGWMLLQSRQTWTRSQV